MTKKKLCVLRKLCVKPTKQAITMIDIQGITKRFGKTKALDAITATFTKGQAISLIGPNGSGKTTLIKCLLGMVIPNEGQLLFKGIDVTTSCDYRRDIGYMPQIGRYPDNMRISQIFDMMIAIRKNQTTPLDEELIDAFDLKQQFDKPMRTLSGGTIQKVSACLAFLFDPSVLVLDEPTAGLDPLASEILKAKVLKEKNRGKLILMTSHVLSDLEDITTDVLYLQDGKLQFFQPVETLKFLTNENRLARAIAAVMSGAILFKKEENKTPLSIFTH
jgi:Cu-processing system ATP-binding protein